MDINKIKCPVCGESIIRNKEYPNSTLYYCSRCEKYYGVMEVRMHKQPK